MKWPNPSLRQITAVAGLMLTTAVTSISTVYAQTAEEKGLAIAQEADRRNTGWQDSAASMTMILRNKRGDETSRELSVKALEVADDGDKSLTVFNSPRDVKGTALLSFSHKVDADDQWLYLPKLGRVKRIASRNKSGPFMGSEFAFEDMTPQEVEKYTYKFIKEEELNGQKCFVVERYPVDKYSGYTKQLAWVDQEEYRTLKVEFYDRKKSLLKTLTASEWKEYLDQYWRPHSSTMINHQTGKSTDLVMSDFTFKNGLDDGDFNKNSLKRAR
ncbi:outer membrane lipoprotein-sorting protein [Litoribrevibacter euphylliae]|uniref:Outer membrane lipoprotein-sorting protein n=1 Tax=Litoribrevibacter euphylliae TaxID=1834034 RepID=A0ABV7HCK4_9GAMM